MDTWLLLAAVFSTGVLAGPLPQTGTGNHEPISQRKVEGEDHFPNTPSNSFSSSSAIPNGAQFSRNFVPQALHDFSRQNGGFARNLNDRGSTEVVQVVHPSLVDGFSSLEELGISSPNFPAGSNNNFGGFRSNGGAGFSRAESGVNNRFGFSNGGNHPFNIQGFPPPNFGNGGFRTPAIEGHGFRGLPVHARTSGFADQTFVPNSNNFVNGGFHNPSFGPGFNPTPFIGGHPFANSFFPFGQGGIHFNPNFPQGNFANGGFIPHLPPQNTRVILQSVPVVVGILNETHARVTPHNQDFGNNPNFARFSLNSERKTSEIKPNHHGEGIRANLSPETDGFGHRAHQGSLFSQNSDRNSFQSEQNNNPSGIPTGTSVSFNTAEQSFENAPSFQNELSPVAEALIFAPNNDRPNEINREGLPSQEESSKSNLIQSEGTTKFNHSDKVTGLTTSTDDSRIFATSSSFGSNTDFGNLFSSDFSSTAGAGLPATPEEIPIQVGQSTLPVPSALASFAAIGTPPAENSHFPIDTVKPFHGESVQLRTSSLAETTTPQEITALRPSSPASETINVTPISTFPVNFNTPADIGSLNTRLHSGISSDAELALLPSGDNVNAHSASQGILTGGTGTSVAKLMHVGDHVSVTPGNEQVNLESFIQLSTGQGKAIGTSIGKMMQVGDHVSILPEISNLASQVSPGASSVISSTTDESPVGNEFRKECVTKCRCRFRTKNCATQALEISGQSPVGSSALETHEVSTPAVAISHSKFSASKPSIPFTITPSPVTAIHSPSFDGLASSQLEFDTVSEQTISNLDHIGSTGVSATNIGVSGITSVNAKKFSPHAIIIFPQSGSESVLPNFQQEGITPAPFPDTLNKRLGGAAIDIANLAIADENIKNTQVTLTQSPVEQTTNTAIQIGESVHSSQLQPENGIQVTSRGISSPVGQVTTQAPIIASAPLQGQETLSSFGTSTSAEPFVTRTDGEISGLNAASVLTDPNFVLTIPLSLLSQTARSPAENVNAAIGTQAARVADPTANILNTFSFTTDPQEVLKILNAQSRGLGSSSGFSQTFGLNSDTPGSSSQQPQIATIEQEPQVPGQSEVVPAASPSGSLSFRPETLANDSGASGHGVPLIPKPFQTLGGIQEAEASNDKISQNQSKLGNNLKRELPLAS